MTPARSRPRPERMSDYYDDCGFRYDKPSLRERLRWRWRARRRWRCWLLGHKRESYVYRRYIDRRGREREKWGSRCIRCGTSDAGTVYEPGLIERLRDAWRERRAAFARWRLTKCSCCGKPLIRFGRQVGNHGDCDDIPF